MRHFDDEGYIILNEEIKNEFINNLQLFLINKGCDIRCLDLFNSSDLLDIFPNNEKIFIHKFYETFAFRSSTLILKNILYEVISTSLYFIYFFSTTLFSFEEYFNYHSQLVYDDKKRIKFLSDYILHESDPFEDNEESPTSFRLLSLGHLLKKDFDITEDFILERPDYAYARIALELNKNHDESQIINTFNDIKKGYYAPSTPMFFHSLTHYNLLSSFFLA